MYGAHSFEAAAGEGALKRVRRRLKYYDFVFVFGFVTFAPCRAIRRYAGGLNRPRNDETALISRCWLGWGSEARSHPAPEIFLCKLIESLS